MKKFWASGWGLLPIQRTDSTTCGSFITKPLGAGSYMMSDSSDGRPYPALYGSKVSVSKFHSVPIPFLIIGDSWYRKKCTKVSHITTTYMMVICH
jgi:hypothetical protein